MARKLDGFTGLEDALSATDGRPPLSEPGQLRAAAPYSLRNTLAHAWLRRGFWPALRWTVFVIRSSPKQKNLLVGILMFLRDLPWIVAERKPVPPQLEKQMRILDEDRRESDALSYG